MRGRYLFNILSVMVLLTIVWALFIIISIILSILLFSPDITTAPIGPISIIRIVSGTTAFILWVYAWKKLTEIWLYKILLRRRK